MPNEGDSTILRDSRDGKKYIVGKSADGNYWMLQNLDHDIKTDGSVTYDNTTTDLGWNGFGYSSASWSPSAATYPTSITAWNGSDTTPESYDPGEQYWNGGLNYNSKDSSNYISSSGSPYYHLGNYYNWTAAVAMNDSFSYINNYTDVNQSICPSGWTLPKAGDNTSSGSFQYLVEKYGWSNNEITNPYIWDSPIKLSLAGSWSGSLDYAGNIGPYWSSVVRRFDNACNLSAGYGGYVNPGSSSKRNYGFSVRCAAR